MKTLAKRQENYFKQKWKV